MSDELLQRWRLILGKNSQESLQNSGEASLKSEQKKLDDALGTLYENSSLPKRKKKTDAYADLSESAPNLAKWLADIREFFPEDIVSVIQKDAINRRGLDQLLYEPELLKELEPDLNLVGILMCLKEHVPEASKEAIREIVKRVVEKIKESLAEEVRRSVSGAVNRFRESHNSQLKNLNWKKTIEKNLKHWQSDSKKIVPEKVFFHSNSQKTNNWTVIVNLDQSGSMAESVIYGAVMGSIFASLPALETRVVAFDTSVVDLTEECGDDPVDMLLGIQLGGGTHINKAIQYSEQFIHTPSQTIFILISDLFEAGNENAMLNRVRNLSEAGVKFICLLSLSDSGIPFYNSNIAQQLNDFGVPCFGCSPDKIPELIRKALNGSDPNL
ncbi:MAG: VWA domain-containing protein [Lentisphaeraceae bacterium]|nr:VWA domain-containing protein [Lentisphaeraceae bacterium]